MRKIAIALGVAAAAVSTPTLANEGRVEARGGIVFANGTEEAVAGVAAGYDFDLGKANKGAFIGIEGSADKVLANGADVVWGATGRIGTHVGENGKLFVAGGYSFGEGEDTPHLGAGYEHKVGKNVYLKAEYRHFFSDVTDADVIAAGVGFKF